VDRRRGSLHREILVMDHADFSARASKTQAVLAHFKAHPLEWIDASVLLGLGGKYAWRTRCSEARKLVQAEGGQLENRNYRSGEVVISEYRYLPYVPLAREGEKFVAQASLF
jgi:hypothetical protein